MAYQSEIEFRVKVIDAELKDLEKRIERVQNPFGASGARKGAAERQSRENLRIEKERLDFVKKAAEDEERLRIAKARNTSRVKQRLLEIDRANRIKAVKDVARAEEALARQKARRREDLALGVGFPLLFGGGAGAITGGALGAIAGGGKGGFGLQILFSALGQQVDNFFATVQESATSVAAAMDGTSASLEAVKEAGIVVRDSTIEYIQDLEESGRSLDAYNAVQRELNSIYGTDGVTVLKELKGANEFANTEAGKLSAVLQTELAPAFIVLAQLSGVAARALANIIPAVIDSIGEFTLGTPGASTTAQIAVQRPVADQGLIDAGVRQREQELRTDVEIQEIIAGTEALRRQTEVAELNNDLTDKRVVALKRSSIENEAQNKIFALQEKALADMFNKDLQRLTAAKIQKIEQQETFDLTKLQASEQKAIATAAEQAAREQDRLAAAAARKAKAANAESARNLQAADSLTISLQQQLKQIQLAGTEEGKRNAIEVQYENTLRKISALKDQDYADSQRNVAAEIRTAALAKLAFEQEQRRAKALRDAVAPLKQIRDSQEANLAASKEYNRLIMEGVLPAEAKRIVEYNKQVAALILQKNELIKIAEAKLLSLDIDSEQAKALRQRIDDLKEERGLIEGKAAEGPGKGKSDKERIEDAIGDAQGELNKLIDPVNQVVAAAGAIGDAFSESFKGVISGSMSAQQALANLFQKTADHFLDMTAQIIAAAIKAQAIQFIGSIIGATAGASATASAGSMTGAFDSGVGGIFPTSPSFSYPLAEGGYVSGPTNALIGEGGEPEYVIPESKMRTAMSRYSRGSRGNSVIPESGATEAMGEGGGTAIAAPIDVRYTVERINSVDYVTADQFQTGMQQAAQQGAKQGEQQTLKRLQMSGSTRKRIGI